MFAAARLMILTKTDLLPHLRFDLQRCLAYAHQVNPAIQVLLLSAASGEGMDAWIGWLRHEWDHLQGHAHHHHHEHGPRGLAHDGPTADTAGFVDLGQACG
jgi:hydrogenase nickel incorporation protein HypB